MFRNRFGNVVKQICFKNGFKPNVIKSFKRLSLDHPVDFHYFNNTYRNFSNFSTQNLIKNENPFETDEYITQIQADTDHLENKKKIKDNVIETLKFSLRLTDSQINKLLSEKFSSWANAKKVIKILLEHNIYKQNILNNPWLIRMNASLLKAKFGEISTLEFRNINDLIPLLKHSVPRLQKLVKNLQNERNLLPKGENRLYYISDRLNTDALTVCHYVSKRLFILEMPFDLLQENLNYMIEFGVAPISILKDLWAFRYTPKSVKARLTRVKDAKKDKIMPWMVRCPERILEKTLKLSLDEQEILGENNTVIDYLSKRLEFDKETMNAIMLKQDQVLAVRVPKIKEILDYLLDEEGFTKYDIAQVPRILCHGLETTKARIEELKAVGCRPTSLVILCRSRREYEKFVQKWLDTKNRIEQQQKS